MYFLAVTCYFVILYLNILNYWYVLMPSIIACLKCLLIAPCNISYSLSLPKGSFSVLDLRKQACRAVFHLQLSRQSEMDKNKYSSQYMGLNSNTRCCKNQDKINKGRRSWAEATLAPALCQALYLHSAFDPTPGGINGIFRWAVWNSEGK